MHIDIEARGTIDQRESAYPQAVQLPDGQVLCSFSVGGGSQVTGGTELARSSDGGRTWMPGGVVLPPTDQPRTANFLKLSYCGTRGRVYAYGARIVGSTDGGFGRKQTEPVVCSSDDQGRTWSPPRVVPMDWPGPYEVSHGATVLASGRLLAPAATLVDAEHLGERVVLAISDDGGEQWDRHALPFVDPAGKQGFFEHKFVELSPDCVLGVCWTVTLGQISDLPNHYALSQDGGLTWTVPRTTGVQGQTMTPVPISPDRLLVLFNRRYGRQGIVMHIVDLADGRWNVVHEQVLYDAKMQQSREDADGSPRGFDQFAFGFPTAIRLQDGGFLATYWSREGGAYGVRWARLRIRENG